MDKRFIEESFPVKEVGEESAKEKNIRHSHISTLHIWWARRPLASSRATSYAALIPAPKDEIDWVKKRNFIIELAKWENSLNKNLIQKARSDILDSNNGIPPKVLDPFTGGGSIPLEALRLGCETYANDYNPVAVLLEKCILEYPQKYGNSKSLYWGKGNTSFFVDLKKWINWVYYETKKEMDKFYPIEEDGSVPIGYIWARTIKCQNPTCNAEIPLLRQLWLAKKRNKKIALKPIIKDNEILFEILGQENEIPSDFDPSKGTISKAVVKCPACNTNIDANKTRELFLKGNNPDRLLAVVLKHPKKQGKKYRLANNKDVEIYRTAEYELLERRNDFWQTWNIDPVPNEELPPAGTLGFRVQRYGILKWGDIFNSRQKLALITFIQNLRKCKDILAEKGQDKDYIKAIVSFLALSIDMVAAFSNTLARWENTSEAVKQLYARHALPMLWDYAETNPFGGSSGSFESGWKYYIKVIEHCGMTNDKPAYFTQSSATSLKYPDDYFDAVFTDPPYYDNIPYSHLSDFFYVWLKRTVGDLYPELFSTPLTPKSKEIVAYTNGKTWDEAKNFFEEMLKKSFQEIYRVLKPNGITTIVYAHKTTTGWEAVINAILDSGLTVTSTWPVSTEMRSRQRAKNSAALASSIYIVARKFEKSDVGWLKNIKSDLKLYIPQKLDKLWEEGISGADFFITAIGSAIEIFGKFEKVLDNEGNEIRANTILSFVRDVVTDYTVRQILHDGIVDELSPLTKYYLMSRWNYGEVRVPFDEARKLAQSAGIDLANEWNKGFIVKRGEFITIQGPDKRDKKSLEDSKELIDVIHYVCLLWKGGKVDEMKSVLKQSGYGEGESLYKVAQAISETLPNNSSEKKMIEGFLAGRDSIMQDMREDDSQTKLV